MSTTTAPPAANGAAHTPQRWAPRPTAPPAPVKVQWDTETNEPFLALESHPHLRLTPMRDTADEIAALTEISNHPDVGRWSYGRPYPYTPADARDMLDELLPAQQGAIAQLRAGGAGPVETFPFMAIRETATGRFIGDVRTWSADKERPDVAELSYTVHPSMQRQGIASAALTAALGFMAASMGITKVEAMVEVVNPPSLGLMEKLGFIAATVRPETWPEAKGGGERQVVIHQREFGTPPPLKPSTPFPTPEVKWSEDGEPYLDLIPGFILTPYRNPADVKGLMELCNAPEVGKWSHNRAFPFMEEHAHRRLETCIPQAAAVAAMRADPNVVLDQTPFSVIREVATGRYCGDTVVRRQSPDRSQPVWLAYALHPDYHRNGLATAAATALLGWAKAGMAAERAMATAQTDNPASGALLTKLGFTCTQVKFVQFPPDKGGDWREAADWLREL